MKYVNPYNTVEFYVCDITEPHTIKIYTDSNTYVDIEVSEGYMWYTCVLPKDKGLCMIVGDSVKKVVVKADINGGEAGIIPSSTVEASFKVSNTSNVTYISDMFRGCTSLKIITMKGCSEATINKIKTQLTKDGIINNVNIITE